MKNTRGAEILVGRGINGMGERVWMYIRECEDNTWVGYYQPRKKLPTTMHPVDYWPSREAAETGMRDWNNLGQTSVMRDWNNLGQTSVMTHGGPLTVGAAARALRSIPSKKRSDTSRANGAKGGRPRGNPKNTSLTDLQRQALDLRQQGLSIREIAARMGRQTENIRQLLARVASKLNIPGGWTGIKKKEV